MNNIAPFHIRKYIKNEQSAGRRPLEYNNNNFKQKSAENKKTCLYKIFYNFHLNTAITCIFAKKT